MTEAQLTRRIADLAQGQGLLAHWCRDSRKCYGHKGFPDLVIAGRRGVIFAEIKMLDAETSAAQDWWAYTLDRGRVRWILWRPADLEDGTIERELRELA